MVIIISLCILAGLFFYGTSDVYLGPGGSLFVPSDTWHEASMIISLIIIFCIALYFVMKHLRRIKLTPGNIVLLSVAPFILYILIFGIVVQSAGKIYTKLVVHDTKIMTFTVTKDWKTSRTISIGIKSMSKMHVASYCLNSKSWENAFLVKKYCIQKDDYENLPNLIMQKNFKVRQSFFGTLIENYQQH
ncbi:MAG TPA: hypothetical protein VGF14_01960 [Alphaproteobacteria bacterium]